MRDISLVWDNSAVMRLVSLNVIDEIITWRWPVADRYQLRTMVARLIPSPQSKETKIVSGVAGYNTNAWYNALSNKGGPLRSSDLAVSIIHEHVSYCIASQISFLAMEGESLNNI